MVVEDDKRRKRGTRNDWRYRLWQNSKRRTRLDKNLIASTLINTTRSRP